MKSCDVATGTCLCNEGWAGNKCDVDVDECNSPGFHKCPAGTGCKNTPGSYACLCKCELLLFHFTIKVCAYMARILAYYLLRISSLEINSGK